MCQLLKKRDGHFFSLKEKLPTEYKSAFSICPSYLIPKRVFSEGNHGLWGRTLDNNEEKGKEETENKNKNKTKGEALIVLNQKPLFLWRKFSK